MKIEQAEWLQASSDLEDMALDWWKRSMNLGLPGAVKFLSNDELGTLVVVTRGEYADEIKAFIETLK